jgi:hypothetical protein
MVETTIPSVEEILTNIDVNFYNVAGGEINTEDFTIQKVILGESLLTPGLQTSIEVDSYRHNLPVKNFDGFKNGIIDMKISRPVLSKKWGFPFDNLNVTQRIYRLENRSNKDTNNESFTIRACDDTLLNDATTNVSKSWKCARPSDIAQYVLSNCAGSKSLDIESCGPARDYIAENIHPFQVVAQQLNVSLAEGDDPSFVHYMTYEKYGTHHFRSIKSLSQQSSVFTFEEQEVGVSKGYAYPKTIMTHMFPCDFDLLSDVLNGVSTNGRDINSVIVFNPVNKMFSLVGDQTLGCGIGSGVVKMAQTNRNTAQNQNSCNSEVEKYLLKRQARMSLLERDKIALRLTVPWNPLLNVGKVITANFYNKESMQSGSRIPNYGSGDYLILHMFHEIRRGGYATTVMDCVSTTVGQGVV